MEEVKKQEMESLFCPYDLALELKELGFNEGVLAQYRVDGYLCWGKDDCSLGSDISDEDYKNNCFPEFGCRAALWQQAFRFFREKHNLEASIQRMPPEVYGKGKGDIKNYLLYIWAKNLNPRGQQTLHFDTYEEAEFECLVKLIEIANEQTVK